MIRWNSQTGQMPMLGDVLDRARVAMGREFKSRGPAFFFRAGYKEEKNGQPQNFDSVHIQTVVKS